MVLKNRGMFSGDIVINTYIDIFKYICMHILNYSVHKLGHLDHRF